MTRLASPKPKSPCAGKVWHTSTRKVCNVEGCDVETLDFFCAKHSKPIAPIGVPMSRLMAGK